MGKKKVVELAPAETQQQSNVLYANRTDTISKIYKKKGMKSLMSSMGNDAAIRPRRWCQSEFLSLDYLLGLGRGIPLGLLLEIWGEEGAGKSHIALKIAALLQRYYGAFVVLGDIEQSIDPSVLLRAGLDVSEDALGVITPADEDSSETFTVEDTFAKMMEITMEFNSMDSVTNPTPLVVITDSLAHLSQLGLEEAAKVGSASSARIGSWSMAVQNGIKAYKPLITNHNTLYIACNQVRSVIYTGFRPHGAPDLKPAGPHAWFHAVDVRLFAEKKNRFDGFYDNQWLFSDIAKASDQKTGMMIQLTCQKSKVSMPYVKIGLVNELGNTGLNGFWSSILHAAYDLKTVFKGGLQRKSGIRSCVVEWHGNEYNTQELARTFAADRNLWELFVSEVRAEHDQIREERLGAADSMEELLKQSSQRDFQIPDEGTYEEDIPQQVEEAYSEDE